MGNICASSQFTSNGGRLVNRSPTAKIIHLDGKLQELRHPVQATHVLSQNPNFFLCTSESMDVDSYAPQVPEDEELQLGQIYFLMPLSQTKSSLSLQDLCSLAIKASAALANPLNARRVASSGRSPASDRNGQNVGACKVPTGIDIVGMETRVGRGNQRIEL
ncbi:hypothetical protein FF1_003085 [Malus domestica]